MVAGEYFDLPLSLKHHLDQGVDVFRLLGLFPHLSKHNVRVYAAPDVDGRIFLYVFVAHQADFVGVHEVIAMSQVDLFIPQLHPDQLLHQLVAPALHDLQGGVELCVQNPKENEPLISDEVQWEFFDFVVAHGVVLEGKLTIRKHKLGIIFLGPFDPPWWVDDHDIELTHILHE